MNIVLAVAVEADTDIVPAVANIALAVAAVAPEVNFAHFEQKQRLG